MLTLVYMDARADALHVDAWCLDVDALCVGLNVLRAMRMKKEGKKVSNHLCPVRRYLPCLCLVRGCVDAWTRGIGD